MQRNICNNTKKELLQILKKRHNESTRKEKTKILNEFVSITGFHRKHAIRLMRENRTDQKNPPKYQRIYDEAVKEALIVIWEASDRICGKRLKAILPTFIESLEKHSHLKLDPEIKEKLHKISASTIDRILKPVKKYSSKKRKLRKKSKPSKKIPIRTFSEWADVSPGNIEIDFVVHCGDRIEGAVIHTLVGTDVCSGWTECIALLAREQSLVVEGLKLLAYRFPGRILSINSDNDSAFINETLIQYCKDHNIKFSRSRPYRKNDQAWIEQKNGAVVRRIVGNSRYSGVVAAELLVQLYQTVRLYVNYFQPSFKLISKQRDGSKVKKTYDKPQTPCDRMLQNPQVNSRTKEHLRNERNQLDPLALLKKIRDYQEALSSLSNPDEKSKGPRSKSLQEFLANLPKLWREGEARATHRKHQKKARYWRTRKDPYKEVWPEVLEWLQENPDATAKSLFIRLQEKYPGKFYAGQKRTLERRVKEWRHIMAKEMVYSGIAKTDCKATAIKSAI